jgi:hypothetical protein
MWSSRKIVNWFIPAPFKKIARAVMSAISDLRDIRDLILLYQTGLLQQNHPNPLNGFGNKCFSQSDEDGITIEILKRIKCLDKGTFAEFGVGNGTENNTLILKALGWKGFWCGGEELAFDIRQPKEVF